MNRWWWRLAKFAPPHWRGIVGIGLLMMIGAVLSALAPWPMKVLVDSVFPAQPLPERLAWLSRLPGQGSPTALTAWLAMATVLLFIGAWTAKTLHAYVQSGVALRISYALGSRVFERLQQLSIRFHAERPTGDLIRRVTRDSRCARDLLIDVMLPAQSSLITVAAITVMMFQLNPWLTAVTLLVVPAVMLAQKIFYHPMQQCALEQHRREGEMQSEAEQALTALPMVQVYGHERWQASGFRRSTERTLDAYFRGLSAQLKFAVSVNGATAMGQAVVMVAGGYLALQGSLTVGGLLVFFAYLGMLYEPLTTLANLNANLAEAESSAQRVLEILDADDVVPDQCQNGHRHLPSPLSGTIQFENVEFGYSASSPVLQDIDLKFAAGETVALMGRSGSGKTTLLSLLLRFFDPQRGSIRLDGIDIKDLPLEELRNSFSVMLQEPFLLPVSVAENIAYGRPLANADEIERAAIAAAADPFIRELPNGYETMVGERGCKLSSGQKQRLAIARAILKGAPILLLDEPTSSLDVELEHEIMKGFSALKKKRTTVVVAHRLSTVVAADRIVMLDRGRIVAVGKHAELIDNVPEYREMFAAQFGDTASNREEKVSTV